MNAAAYVLMAVMAVVCALLVFGSRWMEVQYFRKHPPDEGDGMTEEKFEEVEDDGKT